MRGDGDGLVAAIVDVVARIMDALERMEFVARHLHPPDVASVVEVLGDADAELRAAHEHFAGVVWPEHLLTFRDQAELAAGLTLRGCDGLREAGVSGGLRQAMRALRQASRAQEALYPVAKYCRR